MNRGEKKRLIRRRRLTSPLDPFPKIWRRKPGEPEHSRTREQTSNRTTKKVCLDCVGKEPISDVTIEKEENQSSDLWVQISVCSAGQGRRRHGLPTASYNMHANHPSLLYSLSYTVRKYCTPRRHTCSHVSLARTPAANMMFMMFLSHNLLPLCPQYMILGISFPLISIGLSKLASPFQNPVSTRSVSIKFAAKISKWVGLNGVPQLPRYTCWWNHFEALKLQVHYFSRQQQLIICIDNRALKIRRQCLCKFCHNFLVVSCPHWWNRSTLLVVWQRRRGKYQTDMSHLAGWGNMQHLNCENEEVGTDSSS